MNTQDRVREFHKTFRLPVDGGVGLIEDAGRLAMRLALVDEEAIELEQAVAERDIVDIADALADLAYVTYGFAAELGIDLDLVIEEVHRSNMSKLWSYEDSEDALDREVSWSFAGTSPSGVGTIVTRGDGKVVKPPTFSKPRIYDVLRRQGWSGR